jgi:phosphoribosylanthranilate isomerase
MLQFHGDESPAACGSYGRPYIKAVAMGGGVDLRAYAENYPDAAGFLLDSHLPGQPGGTGATFDWSQARVALGRPLILAGGLTPSNVAEAIHTTRAHAIDVSSGVESSPGVKDPDKIADLIDEVNRADTQ